MARLVNTFQVMSNRVRELENRPQHNQNEDSSPHSQD
jgi:hypothetical protein